MAQDEKKHSAQQYTTKTKSHSPEKLQYNQFGGSWQRWSWKQNPVAVQIFSQFLLKFIRNKPFIFIKYHHFKCVKRCAIFYTVAHKIAIHHVIFHRNGWVRQELLHDQGIHSKWAHIRVHQSYLFSADHWVYWKKSGCTPNFVRHSSYICLRWTEWKQPNWD